MGGAADGPISLVLFWEWHSELFAAICLLLLDFVPHVALVLCAMPARTTSIDALSYDTRDTEAPKVTALIYKYYQEYHLLLLLLLS